MEKPQYLRLEEVYRHNWAFNRPAQWEFFDRKLERAESLDDAGEPEKAIQACLEIIETCAEYLPAVNNLGCYTDSREDWMLPLTYSKVQSEWVWPACPRHLSQALI
jgi:hypothetical protein